MSDFSLAAIARLIPLGLARQGIQLDLPRPPQGPHIALSDKRHMLNLIAARHGDQALVRIGEGIFDAPNEPSMSALLLATDPHDLINRWQRLERFAHSKHRTHIEQELESSLTLCHQSVAVGMRPTRSEDLLVFGLLTSLLVKLGTKQLTAHVTGEPQPRLVGTTWQTHDWPQDVSTWTFEWEAQTNVHEATRLSNGNATDRLENWTSLARDTMDRDPGRGWTLVALASALNTSSRSLQRKLRDQQTGFSQLLAQIRSGHAARLLITTEQSAAEIGYCCGYSDQAHFTREFKRYSALTPVQYRDQFGKNGV